MTGDVAPKRVTRRELKALLREVPGAMLREQHTTVDGKQFTLQDGSLVGCSDGSRYVVGNMARGGFTLRREVPRARGKAARRAEKQQRARDRREREYNGRLELRRRDRQERVELEA